MEVTAVISERAGHIPELVEKLDLTQYDALIAIGGDGAMWEGRATIPVEQIRRSYEIFDGTTLHATVIQGLMNREDWEKAIRIPVGVVPAGSGNGLTVSVMHAMGERSLKDPTIVAHMLSKRETFPMDLMVAGKL